MRGFRRSRESIGGPNSASRLPRASHSSSCTASSPSRAPPLPAESDHVQQEQHDDGPDHRYEDRAKASEPAREEDEHSRGSRYAVASVDRGPRRTSAASKSSARTEASEPRVMAASAASWHSALRSAGAKPSVRRAGGGAAAPPGGMRAGVRGRGGTRAGSSGGAPAPPTVGRRGV